MSLLNRREMGEFQSYMYKISLKNSYNTLLAMYMLHNNIKTNYSWLKIQ